MMTVVREKDGSMESGCQTATHLRVGIRTRVDALSVCFDMCVKGGGDCKSVTHASPHCPFLFHISLALSMISRLSVWIHNCVCVSLFIHKCVIFS